jgi:hypothetical protein
MFMGGLTVLFCGDPQQLPPVGDTVLYQAASANDSTLKVRASYIYDTMTRSPIILDEVMRQDDPRLLQILSNCASGKLTKEDWKLLQTRNPDRVPNFETEFKDAVRLFQDKESVKRYNSVKISSLNSPIARIQAEHNSPATAKVSADVALGLQSVVHLCVGARVMVTKNVCAFRKEFTMGLWGLFIQSYIILDLRSVVCLLQSL